jgi:hypothetical protein
MRRLRVKHEGHQRPIERVDMIDTETDVFAPDDGAAAQRTRRDRFAVGGVALLVVAALAAAWPRSSGSPHSLVSAPTTIPGRDATVPSAGVAFALTVEPSPVVLGAQVVVQLEGDLSGVSSPISAVAWVDEQVSGVWRTIEWMARSPGATQIVADVSTDGSAASPDAVTFAADQPVRFDVDGLPSGTYRLCRYVPLRADGTSSAPFTNPAYVCAPLIVG